MTDAAASNSAAPASGAASPPPRPAPPPETAAAKAAKLGVALALLGVAAWLANARWTTASVDWHLGSIRQNLGDHEAYEAFAAMGDSALPRLEEELRDADPNGRVVAVLAVSQIQTPAASKILAALQADKDPFVAAQSVAACASRKDADTAEAIRKALADERRPIRLAGRTAAAERYGGMWWWFGRGKGA